MFEDSATFLFVATKERDGASTVNDLPVGAVALEEGNGELVTEGSNVDKDTDIRVVQKLRGGQIVASPYFTLNMAKPDIESETDHSVDYEESKEQISFYGATSSGTVSSTEGLPDPEDGKTYTLNVTLRHSQGIYNNTPFVKTIPYKATSTDVGDLAKGLMKSFMGSFKRMPDPVVRCERVSDGVSSQATITATGDLLKVTNGSKTVAFYTSDGASLSTSTGDITENDVVKLPVETGREFKATLTTGEHNTQALIGPYNISVDGNTDADTTSSDLADAINDTCGDDVKAVSASGSSEITITYGPDFFALPPVIYCADDDCLEVSTEEGNELYAMYIAPDAASSDATFELDVPWQGPTGYISIEDEGDDNNGARIATGDVDNWGLMFIGQKQPFDPVTGRYIKTSFHVASSDFDREMKTLQTASAGKGTWEEIGKLEVYSKFNEDGGLGVVSSYPPTDYRRQVKQNKCFDYIYFTIVNDKMTVVTSGMTHASKYNIHIAFDTEDADSSYDNMETELRIA